MERAGESSVRELAEREMAVSGSALEDAVLAERAKAGDRAAFEQLYRGHAGRAYALCLRLAGNAHDAEDLLQEAFVRAWQKLHTFRGDSAFGTWFHRLSVNVVIGALRAKLRMRPADYVECPGRAASASPGLRLDLEAAIAQLPDGARIVFVLHDVEGYRHPEIAALLGIAVGTSKVQLHRARHALRKELGS